MMRAPVDIWGLPRGGTFLDRAAMENYKVSIPEGECGPWRVEKFEVPGGVPGILQSWRCRGGMEPGWYTRLKRGDTLVMSDAPAEVRDHSELFDRATGRGLINGLGIGMCLRGVLLKPEVVHVTVVEKAREVVELVGKHFANDARVTIINDDAFNYRPAKNTRFDFVWHDIWDDICAANYEQMKRLHRKYGRITKWQGSWCRPPVQEAARQQRIARENEQ